MTKDELLMSISELKGALALIGSDLATQVPASGALSEFQSIVDGTRRSVWTVLKAMTADDYQEYVAEFRLRRASGVLQAVMEDMDSGMEPEVKVAEVLRDTLESLVNAVPQPATSSPEGGHRE